MKLVKGDILEFKGAETYEAQEGARAIYKGHYTNAHGDEYITIEWIRDELSNEQQDGNYYEYMFKKVEEIFTQKEDRIFEENKKVMKIEFKEGVQRVIELLRQHDEDFKADMRQDIANIARAGEEDAIDEIEDIIESVRISTHYTNKAIEHLEKVTTLRGVFNALENTVFEEEEAPVLRAFFNVDGMDIA